MTSSQNRSNYYEASPSRQRKNRLLHDRVKTAITSARAAGLGTLRQSEDSCEVAETKNVPCSVGSPKEPCSMALIQRNLSSRIVLT